MVVAHGPADQPPPPQNFERSALEGQRKEKDRGKGQQGQGASHDETGTVVPNEIHHFASSFVLAITRKRW
jgi:hypothetical protein